MNRDLDKTVVGRGDPALIRNNLIGAAVVILADTSASMDGPRFRKLKDALRSIWPEISKAVLIEFNTLVQQLSSPEELRDTTGGTDLAGALQAAARLMPSKVIVISDGEPDSAPAALQAAELIPGTIDVIFVGDEGNRIAINFMRQLSALGGGQTIVRDIEKSAQELLAPELRNLLSLEGPIAL